MDVCVPLSDDELGAADEALRYVKEALADMALSSIRQGTSVMLLHWGKKQKKKRALFIFRRQAWIEGHVILFG